MSPKIKRKIEMIGLLGGIWFVVTLPLPWVITDPDIAQSQLTVILQICDLISSTIINASKVIGKKIIL